MVQKTGPFFDLYQMVKVNEGKENEREELKLTHYGIPFETCIKNVIHHKIQDKEYSLADYVTAYEKAVKELSELIEISEDNPKKKKENAKLVINGRHDPCIVPRAVPVIEAVTAVAILNLL